MQEIELVKAPGKRVPMNDRAAAYLVKAGIATYATRSLEADESPRKPKRQYRRRDMQAEE